MSKIQFSFFNNLFKSIKLKKQYKNQLKKNFLKLKHIKKNIQNPNTNKTISNFYLSTNKIHDKKLKNYHVCGIYNCLSKTSRINYKNLLEVLELKFNWIISFNYFQTNIINYKTSKQTIQKNPKNQKIKVNFINYIIAIYFLKSNTFLHVINDSGELIYSYSSGRFGFSGKQKKSRWLIFKQFYKILIKDVYNKLNRIPIVLHLVNVYPEYLTSKIFKKLTKKFFIRSVKIFNSYPYNGCRKTKTRRLKLRKKSK